MNCSEVRPFLDQRMRSRSIPSVDQAAVHRHLTTCSSCQRTFQSLEQWDEQLSQAMNEVSIPSGLSQRLLVALAESTPADSISKPVTTQSRPRTWWSRALTPSAVAGLLCVVVLLVSQMWKPPMLSPIHVAGILQQPIDDLTAAENSGDLLPRHWSTLKGKVDTGGGKKLDLREPWLSLVVFPLDVRRKGDLTVAGSLLVVPKSRWNSATSVAVSKVPVSEAAVHYASGYVWIAWAETNHVYILALKGELPLLEQLRNRLGGNHSFL